MNKIQEQLLQVFNLPEKYMMDDNDGNLLKNTIQLLINSLSMISELGLENELMNKGNENVRHRR